MRTLDQDRAADAISQVNNLNGVDQKKFANLCKGFPAMIIANGLGQSLAFLNEKKESEYKKLYDVITKWLTARNVLDKVGGDKFLKSLSESSIEEYRMATQEALAYLQWLKRIAAGVGQ